MLLTCDVKEQKLWCLPRSKSLWRVWGRQWVQPRQLHQARRAVENNTKIRPWHELLGFFPQWLEKIWYLNNSLTQLLWIQLSQSEIQNVNSNAGRVIPWKEIKSAWTLNWIKPFNKVDSSREKATWWEKIEWKMSPLVESVLERKCFASCDKSSVSLF